MGALLLLSSTSCSTGAPSQLRDPGDSRVSGTIPNIPVGESYVIYLGAMCVTGKPVTPLDVQTIPQHTGLRIVDWGFRYRTLGDTYLQNNQDPGAEPGHLASIPGFTRGPVTVSCSDRNDADEFDVEVQLTAPGSGESRGFAVTYKSGGKNRKATEPYDLTLCSASCPGSP